MANYSARVGVCRGVCVSETQPEDHEQGDERPQAYTLPTHRQFLGLSGARKDPGPLGAKVTQAGRNET